MMQKMFLREENKEVKKIGVMADSHDNIEAIKKAVEVFNEEKVEIVVHAGDIVSPFTADYFKELWCDMLIIYGNNDGDKIYLKERFKNIGSLYNDPYIGELYGKKIAVTHLPSIVPALAEKFDIVIYGHTHEKYVEKNKALIVNPGECCGYLTGIKSIAIIDIEKMTANIIEI